MSGSLGLNINLLLLFLLPVGLKGWPQKHDNRLMQELELGIIAVSQQVCISYTGGSANSITYLCMYLACRPGFTI